MQTEPMQIILTLNPDGHMAIQGINVPDRGTALDMLEQARQATHAQGVKERHGDGGKPRLLVPSGVPLPDLRGRQ